MIFLKQKERLLGEAFQKSSTHFPLKTESLELTKNLKNKLQ
jgi:hypothetical protein